VVAGATALVIPLVAWLMRDDPSEVGLRPYGETGPVTAAPVTPTVNPAKRAVQVLFEAARTRDFWLLAGSFFVCGASTNGLIGTHLISAAYDCGIPEVRAAGLLAVMGIFDLVGTTASGWLSDRYNCRYLLFIYYGLRGLSLMMLPTALPVLSILQRMTASRRHGGWLVALADDRAAHRKVAESPAHQDLRGEIGRAVEDAAQ